MKAVRVDGVFIGKAEVIVPGLCSAINKQTVNGKIWLHCEGLAGDEQADTRFHGGPDRALHHYPREHYPTWRRHYPQRAWQAPEFGENLSSLGLLESQVCIGDLFRWGGALLQVSQPRSPCYRLGLRKDLAELPLAMQSNGRCGWFYRVLREGAVSSDDPLELVQRSYPGLSVAWAIRSFFHFPLERAGLHQLVACAALSERWRQAAAARLASDQVEDWSGRLQGRPAPLPLQADAAAREIGHA